MRHVGSRETGTWAAVLASTCVLIFLQFNRNVEGLPAPVVIR